jgi:hypothetical protein
MIYNPSTTIYNHLQSTHNDLQSIYNHLQPFTIHPQSIYKDLQSIDNPFTMIYNPSTTIYHHLQYIYKIIYNDRQPFTIGLTMNNNNIVTKLSVLCTMARVQGRTSKMSRHSPSRQVIWHGNVAKPGESGKGAKTNFSKTSITTLK